MWKKHIFLLTLQTFRRLLISYVTLLILPLLVSVLVYIEVNSVVTKEIGQTNQASIMQMMRLMDEKVKGFYMIADQLSLDEKIKSLAAVGESITPCQRLVMSDIQNVLLQCKIVNPFIDEIYLYFPKSGYVLSNISRYSGDDFAMKASDKFNMSLEDWISLMGSKGYRNLNILGAKNSTAMPTFVFTQKFLFEGSADNPVIFGIIADGKQLSELLNLLKWNNQGILTVSSPKSHIVLQSNNDRKSIPLEYSTLRNQNGIIQKVFKNKKYFVASVESSISDLQYTCLISSAEYLQSLDLIKRLTLIYTLICLTAGLVLSFFLAMRNYTPIQQLTCMFVERLGQRGSGDINDFDFLQAELKKLLQKNENLESTIYSHKDTIRGNLLVQLLRNRYSNSEDLINSCMVNGINFLTQNCLLIAVVIGKDSTLFFEQNNNKEAETENLIKFMIKSVMEELVGAKHAGYVIEFGGNTLCIVSLSADALSDENSKSVDYEFMGISEKVRKLFAERFGIYLSFAISHVYSSLTELHHAFDEVNEIAEYIEFYGEKNTIIHAESFYNTANTSIPQMTSSLALYRSIAENMRSGDYSAANSEINHFIKTELLEKELPLHTAKLRASGLINIVSEAIMELHLNLDDAVNPMGSLSQVKSIQDLQKQVQDIFNKLETYLQNRHQEQNITINDEVVHYVKEHFSEIDLSVNKIAQEFNVSLPHLSRSFKKSTGVGLLEYIHMVRITEAKRMMKERKFSLQNIMEKSGYSSRITMERAFKKYEGISPGVFRDSETI